MGGLGSQAGECLGSGNVSRTSGIANPVRLVALALMSVFGLGGCATSLDSPAARSLCIEKKGSCSKSECTAARGTWMVAGLYGIHMCSIATTDAGKTCVNSSDCESRCVARGGMKTGERGAGVCHGSLTNNFGCSAPVENEIVGAWLCTD